MQLKLEDVRANVQPVVIGGDILAYSYVRELYRAFGITRTIVLATKDIKMLSSSKFVDYRMVSCITEAESLYPLLESVATEVRAANPQAVLLILGCDDVHARLLSAGKDRLQAAGYVVPYIDFSLLDSITQKKTFYELCEELGIAHPATRYFDCAHDPFDIDWTQFTYPLIAKPSNSAQFQDATIARKRKIYEVESAEEMDQVWRSIRESDYNNLLVVQDFIPGDDSAIYSLTTFSDGEGKVRVAAGGTVCLQDHDPTALGNPLAIRSNYVPEVLESATALLEKLHYRGFANFDLKYDARDDTYKFFEVNTRCGRNTYYMSIGGVNFAKLIVAEWVLGNVDCVLPGVLESAPSSRVRYFDAPQDKDALLANEAGTLLAYNSALYCCVPSYLIAHNRAFVKNPNEMDWALACKKRTKHANPLFFALDSGAHNAWACIMYLNQIRKFKRFFWDTQGKQLK